MDRHRTKTTRTGPPSPRLGSTSVGDAQGTTCAYAQSQQLQTGTVLKRLAGHPPFVTRYIDKGMSYCTTALRLTMYGMLDPFVLCAYMAYEYFLAVCVW